MAAINTISIHTNYRTADGKHHITVEMERKKVAYTLIALENLRFGKVDTVLLKDAALPISGKLKKDGKGYSLSFMGKAIPLSEEHILQIFSLHIHKNHNSLRTGKLHCHINLSQRSQHCCL